MYYMENRGLTQQQQQQQKNDRILRKTSRFVWASLASSQGHFSSYLWFFFTDSFVILFLHFVCVFLEFSTFRNPGVDTHTHTRRERELHWLQSMLNTMIEAYRIALESKLGARYTKICSIWHTEHERMNYHFSAQNETQTEPNQQKNIRT